MSFRDATTGTNLVSFFDNHNVVLSVAWNPAGTLLASATMGDGRIALRDIRTGGLAWILATSRYSELRDGSKAVAYAQQASTLTGGRNAGILSILAAAYAETGDFDNAINCQKQALALVSDLEFRMEFAAELRLYESRQPFRDDAW